jgi:peroxiredoxin
LKKLIYILSVVLLLFSCGRSNIYQIEGRLSNLNNATLFVVYESSEGNTVDTVICDEQGKFSIFREQDENLHVVTIYYDVREKWFTVYPEAGKTVNIKGDAKYPKLLQVKGGRTNNKLSEFKKKAAPLLKEMENISNNTNNLTLTSGEGSPQWANINLELRRIAQVFITANPEEEASAILISEYFANTNDIEHQTEALLNMLSPKLNDHYLVKYLRMQVNKAKTTMIGAKAPDFKVTNIYGQTITSDSFANKYYILAFTALWCDMCRTETMMLDKIATKHDKDSLDILLISLDDEFDKVREVIKQDTIAWNIVTDSASQAINLFEKYNVSSLPKCFLMDKNGRIILRTTNGFELQQAVDNLTINY